MFRLRFIFGLLLVLVPAHPGLRGQDQEEDILLFSSAIDTVQAYLSPGAVVLDFSSEEVFLQPIGQDLVDALKDKPRSGRSYSTGSTEEIIECWVPDPERDPYTQRCRMNEAVSGVIRPAGLREKDGGVEVQLVLDSVGESGIRSLRVATVRMKETWLGRWVIENISWTKV